MNLVDADRLKRFTQTRVRIDKDNDGKPFIVWVGGDIPKFDGEEVVPGVSGRDAGDKSHYVEF